MQEKGSIKYPGKQVIAVAIVTLVIGIALGYVVANSMVTKTSSSNDNIILSPERAKADPDSYAPDLFNGHHTLINMNGKVQGRVVLIGLYVENEQDRYHFLVIPDPAYVYMINENNTAKLGGALMIELLYTDNFVAPRLHIGQHLEIQGPYVTDHQDNHEYNEIDPVNAIIEI